MNTQRKNICIYCGSKNGSPDIYLNSINPLAEAMISKGFDMVYGGGSVGLMGTMADEILDKGGKVTGVIPQNLFDLELAHSSIHSLEIVNSMHERKMKMIEISDFFIALPGGLGTLEEISEVMSWTQLGLVQKPFAFYNIMGFYDPLLQFVESMEQSKFMHETMLDFMFASDNPEEILNYFETANIAFNRWTS